VALSIAMQRWTFLFLCILLGPAWNCQKKPAGPPATYRVRGIVKALPEKSGGMVQVLHEAIPTFKDARGEASGMASMEMPFGMAPTVKLDGIAAGDAIEFTFETRWGDKPPLVITDLSKLPAGTQLKVTGAPSHDEHEGHNHP
jgi:Cu/Ag efflux protein CusF